MSINHPTEEELELTGLHGSSELDASLPDADKEITAFDRLVEKAGQLCAWLVLVAMLISVYEVIARYLFNSPTIWAHETTIFLVAAIFALGGPYALARNRHIQINILHDMLPRNMQKWLRLLNLLIGIGFCIAIGYAAWVLSYNATHTPTGDWRLQTSGSSWDSPLPAYTKIIILLSIVLMAMQLLVRLGAFFRRKP
ncbi:TRAP transporter small permease subunit [Nitrincola iocasae]|uniref:TRAP transporter small permease protein n=1 Tax=Nitrincola iocasae TaxID=2614693 RepID=A0A5J6LAS9_9GAMM|nr:TRAP transporter small permease [Nitrincola iocasae]QEW05372.1 TRAP transporter small permease [Nitrincola iocasae]